MSFLGILLYLNKSQLKEIHNKSKIEVLTYFGEAVMINKQKIKRLAGSAVYNRGMELYRQDNVMKFSASETDEDEVFIQALVKGSGRKKYNVELRYDVLYDDLSDSYCECPAYYSYAGICKHCVAALLEYMDYNDRQISINHYMQERFSDKRMRRSTAGREALETTPAIKRLLECRNSKKLLPLKEKELYGKIRLEPYLECSASEISVEFKIGASHMYVLKDIFEFCRNVHEENGYSYGQKLSFVHVLESFHEDSKGLVQFLLDWVMDNKSHYLQYQYYGYSYSQALPKLRKMPLSTAELEGFLLAMKDRAFMANVYGTGEKLWVITDQPLKRTMEITGQKNGILLSIGRLYGYVGRQFYIYFKEGLIYLEKRELLEPIADFISCMAEIPERQAYIQKKDIPTFVRELLPELEKFYECTKVNFNMEDYGAVPVSFEVYLDAPQKDFVTCRLMAVYGDTKYDLFAKQRNDSEFSRDTLTEMQTKELVASYFNAYDEKNGQMALAGDDEKLYELLTEGISRFQKLGEVYVSDALKRIKVVSSPKVEVGVSLSGDLLELGIVTEDMSMEQLAEILSKYEKKKKYYRLKNGDFVNVSEERIAPLIEMKDMMGLTETQIRKGKAAIPRYRAMYLEEEYADNEFLSITRDEQFLKLIQNMKTVEEGNYEIPASLENILRDYQKKGFLWLKTIAGNGFGGILADDMGLGKTLQVIAFLLSEFLEAGIDDNRRSLIVTPASLVFNWNNEFQKFAPALPIHMITGPAEERRRIIRNSGSRDILITSYDLLKRDLESYEGITFYCQILDEAQYIKNHNTQAARSVKEITAACHFALTGTPVENRLSELHSIFDYLMPGFLYSYKRFRNEIELPVVQNQNEEAMNKLRAMIKPFVLRRLKKDVLKDLPDKLEENMVAQMEGEQRKLYDAHVKRIKLMLDKQTEEEFRNGKIQILSELTRLRQLCCDPALVYENFAASSAKTEMCLDLLKNAIEGGHKILLFSQFTSMLESLQQKMKEEDISYYTLTGATSKEKRNQLVEAFNKDATSVFCISLKAGGTGLNLTSADIVIHYDPWWNLAVQNQATDRAHRIGQKNVVTVYKLIMKDTIEENIIKLQMKKKELADQILAGEEMGSGSFTKEELLELLK